MVDFSRLNFHCPVSYNPADFFIKILSQTENLIGDANALVKTPNESETVPIDRSIDELILKRYEKYAKTNLTLCAQMNLTIF